MSSLTKLWSAGSRLAALTLRRRRCTSADVIQYSPEVLQARAEGTPLVALESTIITHGMPYPQNLETAMQVEHIIREQGATPATVAILSGRLHVGLSPDQLSYLAQARGVVKASRRDLAPVLAAGADGATTVAGTIVAAELAGIPVFVTGGIGGVHRQGEHTLDVSADLVELGRSRTLVVCSGVKSILDIGRTLEYLAAPPRRLGLKQIAFLIHLVSTDNHPRADTRHDVQLRSVCFSTKDCFMLETQGVCVCAFGSSYDFPAFYTACSGHLAPHRARHAGDAARLARAARDLRLASGILVAVPIPDEFAMDEAVIKSAIDRALEEAESKGITGKEVTPFILAAVAKATDGASLAANIALIKNNAKVGADIAVEFSKLRNVGNSGSASNTGVWRGSGGAGPGSRGLHTSARHHAWALEPSDAPVLVIGGANVDRTYRLTEPHVKVSNHHQQNN
ncbi:hypothetical protein JYU34_011396 [Plutella xylostella]|uniref:Pseudouridine-5'-phosphate glycosidase n=1 Tax=Plutella xylostella TaxID=51655 RepID=A0ABQ7QGY0_PLUXY|nr:hypothetical protein JYU34_011396 [Plutella xylostella]